MKFFRNVLDNKIIDYMYHTYKNSKLVVCDNCPFHTQLYDLIINMDYTFIENTSYLESKDGKKIKIDDTKKKCKYACIFYY